MFNCIQVSISCSYLFFCIVNSIEYMNILNSNKFWKSLGDKGRYTKLIERSNTVPIF